MKRTENPRNEIMKRRQQFKALALGVLALALLASGCAGDARADSSDEDATFQRVINVAVAVVAPGPFREMIRVTGTVRADRDVVVSAEEAGVIRELLVARGAEVRAGQPLARIDARVLETQVKEAEARAALARETWDRRRRLFEEDRVGSELAYLEARYQWEQADAAVATLRERLQRTLVRAPGEGILDERLVEVGAMVSAGSTVARIVRIDPIKVVAGIPERFAGDVTAGAAAHVTFDVFPGQAFEGRIGFVGSTVNPRNRTFEIEVVIPNPGGNIKPEMIANVEVTRRDVADAIAVPQDALVRVEQGFVAFVAENEDGGETARVRPVTLGPAQGNRVVVHDGLEHGDRLIVVGHKQVADGDRIRITRPGGEQ
jgi:membrane fusion protein, multidrug efflux system